MKILIFDGSNNNGIKNIESLLPKENRTVNIPLSKQKILICTGCMSCVWNIEKMDPGYCVLNDDMKLIYPTFIHSDLVILMTDILFGGFSFQLKKVIDRLLPVLFTAPLKKRGRDVWHMMRYKKRPAILGIGIHKDKDLKTEGIFKEYICRLSNHWDVPYNDSLVYSLIDDSESIDRRIKNGIDKWVNKKQ